MWVKQEVTKFTGERIFLHQLILHYPRGILTDASPQRVVPDEVPQDLLVGRTLRTDQAICWHIADDLGDKQTSCYHLTSRYSKGRYHTAKRSMGWHTVSCPQTIPQRLKNRTCRTEIHNWEEWDSVSQKILTSISLRCRLLAKAHCFTWQLWKSLTFPHTCLLLTKKLLNVSVYFVSISFLISEE